MIDSAIPVRLEVRDKLLPESGASDAYRNQACVGDMLCRFLGGDDIPYLIGYHDIAGNTIYGGWAVCFEEAMKCGRIRFSIMQSIAKSTKKRAISV